MGKKLVLLLLKNKSEWNLKEVANDFSVRYGLKKIMTKPSYPEALKSYNFVWKVGIFNPPAL